MSDAMNASFFSRETGRSLTVAGATAAALALAFPLQVYLANVSQYAFSPVRLTLECGLAAVALFAALALLLVAADRFLGGFPRVAVAAFLVCVWIESGPLAFDLPELNGNLMPTLASPARRWVDGAVLTVLFLLPVCLYRRLRRYAHLIALGVLTLTVASAVDAARAAVNGSDRLRRGGENLHPQTAVLASVRYSPVRNVFVFIVDSLTGPMCAEIMRADADLRVRFPGFLAYDNVGMADCTKRGIPGIMTGRHFGPGQSPDEYPLTSYGEDSLMAPYLAADCPVHFVPDLLPYGCTNRKRGDAPSPRGQQRYGWSVLLRRSADVPYLSVLDVVLFRALPFAFKADFVYAKIRHDPMHERDASNFWHEHVMFRRLAEVPVSDEPKVALGVFHSWGAHMPRYFDDAGRPLETPVNGPRAVTDASRNALLRLGELFDALRARGIYDRSTIIVCSDHANGNLPPPAPDRKSEERALLWIKAEGADAPFAIRDVPTSTSKIAPLVRELRDGSLTPSEIEMRVRSERRRFNARWRDAFSLFHKGIVFREWIIGPSGEVLETHEWE